MIASIVQLWWHPDWGESGELRHHNCTIALDHRGAMRPRIAGSGSADRPESLSCGLSRPHRPDMPSARH
jgi:hypothetical protein